MRTKDTARLSGTRPAASWQIGMFWRFLAAMFISSCIGTAVFIGIRFYAGELHAHRLFASQAPQRVLDAKFAQALPLLRQAAPVPALCEKVLRTLAWDTFSEDVLRPDSANGLLQLLNSGRFGMAYLEGGRVICSYPRALSTVADRALSAGQSVRGPHGEIIMQSVVHPAAAQPERLAVELDFYSPWLALKRSPTPWNTILLFIAVLNLSCAFALVPLLVRRIRRAQAIAKEWTRGRIESRIEDHRHDEFGDLANSFDRLADSITDVIRVKQDLAAADERNRLAQDLHDTAKQRAFALSLQLTALKSLGAQLPEAAGSITSTTLTLVRQLQQDLANVIVRLSASTIAESGMRKLVDDEMHALLANSGIEWMVDIPDEAEKLLRQAPQVAQQVFLIAMEAVANALKHAGARRIAVRVSVQPDACVLSVEDDGQGFDVPTAGVHGMGIANMRLRARGLPDGHLSIISRPDGGTGVNVRFRP